MDNIDQIAEDLLNDRVFKELMQDNINLKLCGELLELRYGDEEPLNEYE